MHTRLLRQVSSLTSPLENWFSMHPTPPLNLQMWNHMIYECFYTNKDVTAYISLGVPFFPVARVALVLF